MSEPSPPFCVGCAIRGYKSIAFCDVTLEPLTILVGRNGAGKSNFLDALAFLRDVMAIGVTEAVQRRGGWSRIACRTSAGQSIEIEIQISYVCKLPFPLDHPDDPAADPRHLEGDTCTANYHITLALNEFSVSGIEREALEITSSSGRVVAHYTWSDGVLEHPENSIPDWLPMLPQARQVIPSHEIPLFAVVGTPPMRDLWSSLRHMAFYNFIPEAMRRVQPLTTGKLLDQTGWNLAGVLASTPPEPGVGL